MAACRLCAAATYAMMCAAPSLQARATACVPARSMLAALLAHVLKTSFISATLFAAGAGYSLFAGKECARALAKVAVDEKECNDRCAVMVTLPFQALGLVAMAAAAAAAGHAGVQSELLAGL